MKPRTEIVLPFPISANRYWRRGKYGQIHLSDEARQYRELVGLLCNQAGCEPLEGPVGVTVVAYMPSQKRDLMNTEKILMDALQGHAFLDDNQIVHFEIDRYEAPRPKKENAKVIVTIYRSLLRKP